MVQIKNLEGHTIVCTDFRELNVSFPKDDFSLPKIDALVENTMGYEMLSLMDGFSRYNQIWFTLDDQHKTAFTTP